MEKRVSNAIEVFLKAIDKGTLAKGTCVACAVGNLVAHGMGAEIVNIKLTGDFKCSENNAYWYDLIVYPSKELDETYLQDSNVLSNIESTEFTWEELKQIENAFENNTKIMCINYFYHSESEILDDQIKGLEAVIKVMLSFSNDAETNVKEVFTNRVKLKV